MARLRRQRKTGAATLKNIVNKAGNANVDGHYPNVSCAAVVLTDALCTMWRRHQRVVLAGIKPGQKYESAGFAL